jgi:hypothetical protein
MNGLASMRQRLAGVVVQVAERFGRPLRLDPGLLLDLGAEVVVRT